MENPAVSVVIPVYNVELWLSDCLESVLGQTETDIELICVNDGSTDSSRKILEDYSNRDSRIRIIDKENGGLSSARNAGLEAAKGEYIYYLDSDDMLRSDALAICREISDNKNLDVLLFNGKTSYENEDLKKTMLLSEGYLVRKGNYDGVMSGVELFCKMVQNREYKANVGVQFTRRTFLLENDLLFVDGVVYEDADYTLRLMLFSKRIMHIPEEFYLRRIREDSLTTVEMNANRVYGRFFGMNEMLRILKSYGHLPEVVESGVLALARRQVFAVNAFNNASEGQRQKTKDLLSGSELFEFALLVESVAAERMKNQELSKELLEKENQLQNIESSRSYKLARMLSRKFRRLSKK